MEKEILRKLVDLLTQYSSVYRGQYSPSRTSQTISEPGSKILRESLMDHVGGLPIVATFLYPYLNEKIDITKTLLMLAIHDIGETKVGDVLTVTRSKSNEEIANEQQAALSQLDPIYHGVFEEFEKNESLEAKFGHSIDKISANLYELIIEKDVARERHAYFGFNIVEALEKDKDKMTWNSFLAGFYKELIKEVKYRFEN